MVCSKIKHYATLPSELPVLDSSCVAVHAIDKLRTYYGMPCLFKGKMSDSIIFVTHLVQKAEHEA